MRNMDWEANVKINLSEIAPEIAEELNKIRNIAYELERASSKLFCKLDSVELLAKLSEKE